MTKILANDGINKAGLQLLEAAGFHVETNFIPQSELVSKIAGYDILLVRSATKVTKEIIDAGVNLKLIGRGGVQHFRNCRKYQCLHMKRRYRLRLGTQTASEIQHSRCN